MEAIESNACDSYKIIETITSQKSAKILSATQSWQRLWLLLLQQHDVLCTQVWRPFTRRPFALNNDLFFHTEHAAKNFKSWKSSLWEVAKQREDIFTVLMMGKKPHKTFRMSGKSDLHMICLPVQHFQFELGTATLVLLHGGSKKSTRLQQPRIRMPSSLTFCWQDAFRSTGLSSQ